MDIETISDVKKLDPAVFSENVCVGLTDKINYWDSKLCFLADILHSL